MNEILSYSATRQASLIRDRKISSVELISAHLDWIAAVNPQINAAIDVLTNAALTEARLADDAIARGEAIGPLHGVPFSLKDSLELAGSVCTAGTAGRRNAPPATEDATLIARLRQAGAIPIARTNLPDLLFAFESDNLLFGATCNPYDSSRTSGGSSGGEAALIASCGSPLGLGSDAAGSVRLPAAFCGIAAIKPTSGRLPRKGHFPPAGGWIEALWQIGPMARRVEDLFTVMPILTGEAFIPLPAAETGKLRVAFHTDNAGAEISSVVRAAAAALASHTALIEESRPICLDQAFDLEMKLLGPDGGDALRQYLRDVGSTEVHPLLTGWLDKLEPYRTDLAGFAAYWAEWDDYRAAMTDFFRSYDAILCPVYPHAALPHGTSIQEENFRGFAHTMAYNVAGLPGAVVRCGESETGLPIAVQIVAGAGREDIALTLAAILEQTFGGWKPPAFVSSIPCPR
ncbi:MAG: Amidase [Candidatus Solibacter sp.]|nr:Amidase [Candidatus Solibacter sp.]